MSSAKCILGAIWGCPNWPIWGQFGGFGGFRVLGYFSCFGGIFIDDEISYDVSSFGLNSFFVRIH